MSDKKHDYFTSLNLHKNSLDSTKFYVKNELIISQSMAFCAFEQKKSNFPDPPAWQLCPGPVEGKGILTAFK